MPPRGNRARVKSNKAFQKPGQSHGKATKKEPGVVKKLGPTVIAILVFVVLGSAVVQIIQAIQTSRLPVVNEDSEAEMLNPEGEFGDDFS